MLALLKRNFLLYFRNRSGVFFSLLGALISFVLYIIFLQKNLTDAWAQLPNRGPVSVSYTHLDVYKRQVYDYRRVKKINPL